MIRQPVGTEADFFDRAPVTHPSRWQLRRQRRLAALHARRAISDAEFGILTIDNVRRMYDLCQRRGAVVHAVMFGFAALDALKAPGVSYDAKRFGPVGQAVPWVYAYLSDGSSKEALAATGLERTIEWSEACDDLFKVARRRYSHSWRSVQRLERWLDEMHKTFPFISKGVGLLATSILSGVIGWLLHSWLAC